MVALLPKNLCDLLQRERVQIKYCHKNLLILLLSAFSSPRLILSTYRCEEELNLDE